MLPTHTPGTGLHVLRYGWLVDRGGEINLVDNTGETYPLANVSVQQGAWGYDHEGVAKLPRPYVHDGSGKVVVQGDKVLIQFLNGNPRTPVITGGVRRLDVQNSTLPARHDKTGANPNRLTLRLAPLGDAGEELGEVLVELAADDKGSVAATVSDTVEGDVGTSVELRVGDPDGATPKLVANLVQGLMTVGRSDGTARVLVQGEGYIDDEAKAILQLYTLLAGLGLVAPDAQLFATKLVAARANPTGGTYLTDRLKAD